LDGFLGCERLDLPNACTLVCHLTIAWPWFSAQ
jgi:hypothetical protein